MKCKLNNCMEHGLYVYEGYCYKHFTSKNESDNDNSFVSGLVTGIILDNSNNDSFSSNNDSFSGGGGSFDGGGSSSDW